MPLQQSLVYTSPKIKFPMEEYASRYGLEAHMVTSNIVNRIWDSVPEIMSIHQEVFRASGSKTHLFHVSFKDELKFVFCAVLIDFDKTSYYIVSKDEMDILKKALLLRHATVDWVWHKIIISNVSEYDLYEIGEDETQLGDKDELERK